jgi:hypothetical protein
MRYEVRSWIGTGPSAEGDQWWKCWGRRRAQRMAEGVVAEYKERGVADFEVMIFEAGKGARSRWFFSAEREREGLPPLAEKELEWPT